MSNTLKMKLDRPLNKQENGYITELYYKISGYVKKYNSTFEGEHDAIESYLNDILIIASIAYYKNDVKTSKDAHFHGYVRGYMQNHIEKYKNKNIEFISFDNILDKASGLDENIDSYFKRNKTYC